jgi:hypothetical protein
MRRFIVAVLVTGFLLNLTGWAGNVFLPGSMWAASGNARTAADALAFFADGSRHFAICFRFVLAFVLCIVYRLASPGWSRSRMELSILCAVIVWLGGVPMCYLGMINGGYWPAGVSIATTILALVTFFDAAPLLPLLLADRRED